MYREADSTGMERPEAVRAYYRAIDEDDYETLSDLLAGGFVHRRPDTVIEGREEFVAFMRGGRPERDTSHELSAVYGDSGRIAAEGTLYRSDGTAWFGFVDTFGFVASGISEIRTYTDAHPE